MSAPIVEVIQIAIGIDVACTPMRTLTEEEYLRLSSMKELPRS